MYMYMYMYVYVYVYVYTYIYNVYIYRYISCDHFTIISTCQSPRFAIVEITTFNGGRIGWQSGRSLHKTMSTTRLRLVDMSVLPATMILGSDHQPIRTNSDSATNVDSAIQPWPWSSPLWSMNGISRLGCETKIPWKVGENKGCGTKTLSLGIMFFFLNSPTRKSLPIRLSVVMLEKVWRFGAEDITSSADCQTAATDGEGNWQPGEQALSRASDVTKFWMFFRKKHIFFTWMKLHKQADLCHSLKLIWQYKYFDSCRTWDFAPSMRACGFQRTFFFVGTAKWSVGALQRCFLLQRSSCVDHGSKLDLGVSSSPWRIPFIAGFFHGRSPFEKIWMTGVPTPPGFSRGLVKLIALCFPVAAVTRWGKWWGAPLEIWLHHLQKAPAGMLGLLLEKGPSSHRSTINEVLVCTLW